MMSAPHLVIASAALQSLSAAAVWIDGASLRTAQPVQDPTGMPELNEGGLARQLRWHSRHRPRIIRGLLMVLCMSSLVRPCGLAALFAVLCLGGTPVHAQVAPLRYFIPGGSFGFGG